MEGDFRKISHQQSAISSQPSAVSHQQSAISSQPSAVSHQQDRMRCVSQLSAVSKNSEVIRDGEFTRKDIAVS